MTVSFEDANDPDDCSVVNVLASWEVPASEGGIEKYRMRVKDLSGRLIGKRADVSADSLELDSEGNPTFELAVFGIEASTDYIFEIRYRDSDGWVDYESFTFVSPAALCELGSLSGRVFDDETGDGLAGVPVVLVDEDGDVVATTTTDENGDYIFDDLPVRDPSLHTQTSFFKKCLLFVRFFLFQTGWRVSGGFSDRIRR